MNKEYYNGLILSFWQLESIIRNDGFSSPTDFFGFFNEHYGEDFNGVIVRWRDFKAEEEK